MPDWDAMFTRDEQLDWLKSEILAKYGGARFKLRIGTSSVQAVDRDEPGRAIEAPGIIELADLILPVAS